MLDQFPVVAVLGARQVGKTTVAASLALEAARRGRRADVITIVPARRLADALGVAELDKPLDVNNEVVGPASLIGSPAWVEGCRLAGSVRLEGENILTGLDTAAAISLPRGMCVDVLQGHRMSACCR